MRREQLEHVLRAASTIVGERDILVIGSQALLATIPDEDLPVEATTSIEADLALFDDPADEKADQIDGAIGELSRFHETYGYYAQGFGVSTAVLPTGWRASDSSPSRRPTPRRAVASAWTRTIVSSRNSSQGAGRITILLTRCFVHIWSTPTP